MQILQSANLPNVQNGLLIKSTVSIMHPFFNTSNLYGLETLSGIPDQGGSLYDKVICWDWFTSLFISEPTNRNNKIYRTKILKTKFNYSV